ncbi:hypothetical protein FGO68_gene7231 [Halteria grandinella]|uniref:Uncharacterized protein n=1 Tax=Halteria grandinella TaxID=5974 RepID=A0A8J8T644_HALGN|nr:hypothetical protein FGO68_gene7231 [Halteria grandinella]
MNVAQRGLAYGEGGYQQYISSRNHQYQSQLPPLYSQGGGSFLQQKSLSRPLQQPYQQYPLADRNHFYPSTMTVQNAPPDRQQLSTAAKSTHSNTRNNVLPMKMQAENPFDSLALELEQYDRDFKLKQSPYQRQTPVKQNIPKAQMVMLKKPLINNSRPLDNISLPQLINTYVAPPQEEENARYKPQQIMMRGPPSRASGLLNDGLREQLQQQQMMVQRLVTKGSNNGGSIQNEEYNQTQYGQGTNMGQDEWDSKQTQVLQKRLQKAKNQMKNFSEQLLASLQGAQQQSATQVQKSQEQQALEMQHRLRLQQQRLREQEIMKSMAQRIDRLQESIDKQGVNIRTQQTMLQPHPYFPHQQQPHPSQNAPIPPQPQKTGLFAIPNALKKNFTDKIREQQLASAFGQNDPFSMSPDKQQTMFGDLSGIEQNLESNRQKETDTKFLMDLLNFEQNIMSAEEQRQQKALESVMDTVKADQNLLNKVIPKTNSQLKSGQDIEAELQAFQAELERKMEQEREQDRRARADRRKEQERMAKHLEQLQRGEGIAHIKVKKGTKRYWRSVTITLMAWLQTKNFLEKEKLEKRSAIVEDLKEGLSLYGEIAKAWLIKSIKHPLISLIKDPENLNLNFTIPSLSSVEQQSRLMKAKVRLKGILKGLLEQSTEETVPMPLVSFLGSLVKREQYVPDGFLTQFEMDRLNLDKYGALISVSEKQVQMVMGNYILIKVLVCQIMANPEKLGLIPDSQKEGLQRNNITANFRVLASMLYYTVMEFMEQLLKSNGYMQDLYESSGLASIILKQQDLKLFYLGEESYAFRIELFEIIQVWLTLMSKYLAKAQLDKNTNVNAATKDRPASRLRSGRGIGSSMGRVNSNVGGSMRMAQPRQIGATANRQIPQRV